MALVQKETSQSENQQNNTGWIQNFWGSCKNKWKPAVLKWRPEFFSSYVKSRRLIVRLGSDTGIYTRGYLFLYEEIQTVKL